MDLTEYIATGYFLTVPAIRPSRLSDKLIPQEFISLSGCFNEFFPGIWNLTWCEVPEAEQRRIAAVFEMSPTQQALASSELEDLLDEEFGWESVIFDLETAREYRRRYLPPESKVRLIGTALHRDHIDEFLGFGTPPLPKAGEAPEGAHGTIKLAERRLAPATGAQPLGFEPMVFDRGLTCSWLCNGLEQLCFDQLGVQPNASGYIATEAEARRCIELIDSDEVAAEPGLWLPWLMLEYPGQ